MVRPVAHRVGRWLRTSTRFEDHRRSEWGLYAHLVSDDRRIDAVRRSGLRPNMGEAGFDRHCRVAQIAVAAETVLFSVVDEDRQFFPSSLGLVEPFATEGETPLTHSFCKHVVERDAPLVIEDAGSDRLVADSLAQRDLGISSYVGVPVRDDDGNILGALCAAESSPRAWTERDVGVLTDISKSIEAELRLRHSQRSLQRRLDDERLAQEYEHSLNQLAHATNRSQTMQGVSDELADRVGPAIGATLTSIAIVEQNELHFTHGIGVTPAVADAWQTHPLDTTVPMSAAVVTGRVIHLASPADFAAYPAFADAATTLGLASFRAIPFGDEGTGLFGVLGIGWAEAMAPEDVPKALDRIVELARTTLTRAWQFEVERDQARVLERVVLPTALPDTGLYDVAGGYVAPEVGQRVGGDVYDVLVRPDGAVGVMVADAVGHDLTATRAVARLRHAIGVLIMEGYSPAAVMTAVNAYVASSPSRRLVTCVCLLFAADGSTVTIANAGHPQPILLSGATARSVGPVGESLLGRAATSYSEATVSLEPGDLVLSFTDGLIDRRGQSFLDGERWLVEFIEQQPDRDPHAIAARLETELVEATVDDDMAFLILSRPAAFGQRALRWTGPAADVRLTEQRSRVTDWLHQEVPDTPVDDVLLVVTELLTNAREAGAPDSEVSVTIRRRSDLVEYGSGLAVDITVTNTAPPFVPTTEMPEPTSVRGRGLAIIERVARSLDVTLEDGTVTVRAIVEMD